MYEDRMYTEIGNGESWRRILTSAGASLVLIQASLFVMSSANADISGSDPVLQVRGNSAWAYDGDLGPGNWAEEINAHNERSRQGSNRLHKINSYGTDMEMYCPSDDVSRCSPDDLQVYYEADSAGTKATAAYLEAVEGDFVVEPIIDGRIDSGYLIGFNDLSRELASVYADKVAEQVCADQNVSGIQFDVEPFDVTTKNAQYWFYMQIAKNFAGMHSGETASDPFGCVSDRHPQGRVFSVFTFAKVLTPGSESAANVVDMMTKYQNGYVIDSLYDLGPNPTAYLNDPTTYTALLKEEASKMYEWANLAGVYYGFGIPATASAHEYSSCEGFCVQAPDGRSGYPMIQYTRAAIDTIKAIGSPQDDLYMGAHVWQYGSITTIGDSTLLPSSIPPNVKAYLAENLPGPESLDAP